MQSVHKIIQTKSRRMCSVFQCSTYCTKDISLHSFPSDSNLCKVWQEALKIGKPVTKYMLVCSLHFTVNDFTLTTSKLRRLKKQAIPSRKIPELSHPPKKPVIDRSERHWLQKCTSGVSDEGMVLILEGYEDIEKDIVVSPDKTTDHDMNIGALQDLANPGTSKGHLVQNIPSLTE